MTSPIHSPISSASTSAPDTPPSASPGKGPGKFLHRITAPDSGTRQQITALLAELQSLFIRTRTPVGAAISAVIRSWRLEKDGSFLVEFSALVADRLPALSGLELLIAARGLAAASLLSPVDVTA